MSDAPSLFLSFLQICHVPLEPVSPVRLIEDRLFPVPIHTFVQVVCISIRFDGSKLLRSAGKLHACCRSFSSSFEVKLPPPSPQVCIQDHDCCHGIRDQVDPVVTCGNAADQKYCSFNRQQNIHDFLQVFFIFIFHCLSFLPLTWLYPSYNQEPLPFCHTALSSFLLGYLPAERLSIFRS